METFLLLSPFLPSTLGTAVSLEGERNKLFWCLFLASVKSCVRTISVAIYVLGWVLQMELLLLHHSAQSLAWEQKSKPSRDNPANTTAGVGCCKKSLVLHSSAPVTSNTVKTPRWRSPIWVVLHQCKRLKLSLLLFFHYLNKWWSTPLNFYLTFCWWIV